MPLPAEQCRPIQSCTIPSDCGVYRYFLSRTWDWCRDASILMFIMLNPSKATDLMMDKTVMLCTNRAVTDGFGALWVLNIFAYQKTNPQYIPRDHLIAIGQHNNAIIEQKVAMLHERNNDRDKIVCAWGNDSIIRRRDDEVKTILRETTNLPLYHLGLIPERQPRYPKHPLGPLNATQRTNFIPWIEMNHAGQYLLFPDI